MKIPAEDPDVEQLKHILMFHNHFFFLDFAYYLILEFSCASCYKEETSKRLRAQQVETTFF